MIKELFAICSAVSVVGSGPARNYQHTDNVGNTQVTYRYESNEVNDVDDIVLNNIYSIDTLDLIDIAYSMQSSDYNDIHFKIVFYGGINFVNGIGDTSLDEYALGTYYDSSSSNVFDIYYDFSNGYAVFYLTNLTLYASLYFDNIDDFEFYDVIFYFDNSDSLDCYKQYLLSQQDDVILPSYTDFNVIESVNYTQKRTFIGVINEFCEEYLFSEIPNVNSMTFEIGGETISLMTYLVLITGIIVAFGLLILLFFVFKWLFGMFAGIFKVK